MKLFLRIYYNFKIKNADLSDVKENLLSQNYDEKQILVIIEHLKAYLTGSRAGYRLMPSKELLNAVAGIDFKMSKVLEECFFYEIYDMPDRYTRYSSADISFYRKRVKETSTYLRKFRLKIKTSKGNVIYGKNSVKNISYMDDICIVF